MPVPRGGFLHARGLSCSCYVRNMSEKKAVLNVTVAESLAEAVRQDAATQGTTISSVVEAALAEQHQVRTRSGLTAWPRSEEYEEMGYTRLPSKRPPRRRAVWKRSGCSAEALAADARRCPAAGRRRGMSGAMVYDSGALIAISDRRNWAAADAHRRRVARDRDPGPGRGRGAGRAQAADPGAADARAARLRDRPVHRCASRTGRRALARSGTADVVDAFVALLAAAAGRGPSSTGDTARDLGRLLSCLGVRRPVLAGQTVARPRSAR